jgi:hypothetical protein
MPQYSDNFSQLVDLDPVLTEIFFQAYNMHPTTSDAIWATRTSSKAKETDLLIGSFGDPKPFTGTVDYDEAQPDYEVEYVHAEYTNGFIVERKLLDDMQYENIFDRAGNLATSFARWREKTHWVPTIIRVAKVMQPLLIMRWHCH